MPSRRITDCTWRFASSGVVSDPLIERGAKLSFRVTGARFGTQVLANQMYDQSFTFGNNGVGSATAVIIFVLVIPIIVYNVRQMLKNKEVRG